MQEKYWGVASSLNNTDYSSKTYTHSYEIESLYNKLISDKAIKPLK